MTKCKHKRQKLLLFHHSLREIDYEQKKEYLINFYFCKSCNNMITKRYELVETKIIEKCS
mgnify:CR=1 FL=1